MPTGRVDTGRAGGIRWFVDARSPRRRIVRRSLPALALTALLAIPALAQAEPASIPLEVPSRLLGAPVPLLRPASTPLPGGLPLAELTPAAFAAPSPAGGQDAFLPMETRPVASPPVSNASCRGLRARGCVIWGASAALATPTPPLSPQVIRVGVGGLRAPAIGTWLNREHTVLQWASVSDARYYNVQVFQGGRRVMNAWPTQARLQVPPSALNQGRWYVWVVWPGFGPRSARTYGAPAGRSIFGVTLRPRVLLVPSGGSPGKTVAEVRPRIPYAYVRLAGEGDLADRVPGLIQLDGSSRFVLPVSAGKATGLAATLVDRGIRPPAGLNGPLPG
jgi:hypothetical protein